MTLWNPVYRVTVGGQVVTGATLAGLTITEGRTDIYSQPIAGYCNISLLETNKSAIPYEINQSVTIEVKKTNGTYIYLFGGFISDISVEIATAGATALSQRINIIALGALARLARATYSGSITGANDGDQIYQVLLDTLFNNWSEVPAALTWATYNATETWANAQNVGLGTIDRPGDYLLDSQTGVLSDILSLVSRLATSGLGYIYEDSQGRICYADSTNRSQYLAANGYVELDANQAIAPGMNVSKKTGDVRNKVTLTYTAAGTSSVSVQDSTSISSYGQLASTINTSLANVTDATSQANYYLTLRAYPVYQLKTITFELQSPELDDSDRDALLQVFMGMPVNLQNLPINMSSTSFQGFVEGWTFTAAYNRLRVTLTLSPTAYSIQAFKWSDVSAAEAWNTLSPTLTWLNATIVN